jgi:hypothetical protein
MLLKRLCAARCSGCRIETELSHLESQHIGPHQLVMFVSLLIDVCADYWLIHGQPPCATLKSLVDDAESRDTAVCP